MEAVKDLYHKARQAREFAYAPYSKFKVGAVILSTKGNIYSGCNVENISFPCGTCAEAGAISAMIAGGDNAIQEILVIADCSPLILPCGACLQRIAEFSTPATLIHLADMEGIKQTTTLTKLFPANFSAKELKK